MMLPTPANSTKPIAVPKLPWLDWAGQIIRASLLIGCGVVIGINLCQWREGALNNAGLAALGAFATTGYGAAKKWWDNEKMKRLARETDNSTAFVKGES